MALIPVIEICNTVTYNDYDYYDLCTCTDVNKNNKIYYRIEHAGNKSIGDIMVSSCDTNQQKLLLP